MKKIGIILGTIFIVLILGSILSWTVVRASGKHKIMSAVEVSHPDIETKETVETPVEQKSNWKDGWIKYNDKIYEYDEDLITFLFMGIDKDSKVKAVKEGTNGGQADALFLMVLDKNDKDINIIGINRNTMTDIAIYNEEGAFVTSTKAQIAVQHGFGDGMEESCEYQVDAVRKFLYNLPIHGYAAINMKAIPVINDTVGGVNVQALSDVRNSDGYKIISEGEAVHLKGNYAYRYVQYRNINDFGSADLRLARQKQYLTAFVAQAKAAIKEDTGIISQLYNDILPYMVTNVTFDEIAYLAPEVVNYSLNANGIRTIPGETVMGDEFEEYYVDEDGLYDLIINVFYKEVEE